jgi:ATP-binding cassette subfamily B protein
MVAIGWEAFRLEILGRIARMCKPYARHFLWGMVGLVLANATRLVMPILSGMVVDDVIQGGQLAMLLPLCGVILALTLLRAGTNYMRGIKFERLSQDFTYDLRTGLYRHLQAMPYEFYDKHYVGEIMSRLTGDIEGLRNLLAGGVVQIIENAIWFFGSLVIMFFINVKLALIMFTFAPLVAVIAYFFNKKIRPAFRTIREQNAVLSTKTQENISGVRVVKAFAQEEQEKEEFRGENQKLLRLHLRANNIRTNFIPILELLSNLTTPALLLLGGGMVIAGEVSLGELVIFMNFTWMITGPMRMLGNLINMLAMAITSAEKLFYYMDLGPSIKDREETTFPDTFAGHVRFDNVSFTYGDGMVLRNVSFDAHPGQTIAVMGATGTGKTSVVNLLSRFFECQEGAVTIDGVDVKDMPLHSLRDRIGYVNQETFLFSETIAANIAFGRPDAPMDRIVAAAKAAQAHEFIEEMPRGYDTIVGERGLGLSGGQKQRVSIARALLYDPAILVLDDATSAVDMETEYLIQQDLKEQMKNRTTFVIAHRISSVKDADMILVLDENGAVAERGTHAQLLEHKGIYYGMVQDQYKSFVSLDGEKEAI